ncbi:MAG: amidase [Actinomycetota bacterium]
MDDVAELLFAPATELAGLVRRGEVTSHELVEASLGRIEALDGQIGAFTTVDAERALETAAAIGPDDPRPLAGVPVAVKDLFTAVAGIRLTQCSDLSGESVSEFDSLVPRRLKEAGMVIVGVTKSPEFGILPVTEPRRFGPTRNPYNLDRTPGGSSGGSGAAVAAGMVPVAHASDGGGSIRIPAACCGLVGLKPSRGRISSAPMLGDSMLATDGVLTRTVADTAVLLDLLSGYELGDATWAPAPSQPFATTAAAAPGRLRIAVVVDPPIDATVDPICLAAVAQTADLLRDLGHEVQEISSPWTIPYLLPVFTVIWATLIGGAAAAVAMGAGRELTEDSVEPLTWALFKQALDQNSMAYMGAVVQSQAAARMLITALAPYDAVLTPALAERPVAIGEIDSCSAEPMLDFNRSGRFTPFTAVANLTGQPAIALPAGIGQDAMPVSVQLIGRPAGDGQLLSLATQLETARPWSDQRPSPSI